MITIIRLILKTAEWFIFTVLILIAILILSPYLPTKEYLSTFIVASGSMEPGIQTGSVAIISGKNLDQISVGDVISFASPTNSQQIVIHRVEEKTSVGSFKTKGDNNQSQDPWIVAGSAVKGKYFMSIPYLGYLAIYLKDPKYFAVIVGIPFVIFCILQILKIRKGINEEVEKRTKKVLNQNKVTGISTITNV